MLFQLILVSALSIGFAKPPYLMGRPPQDLDWWYDLGDDWETTDKLEETLFSLGTMNYMKKQMDMYGYAQHIGTINRGTFLNPELNSPRDRAFGFDSDFNPRDFRYGAFRQQPHQQNRFYQRAYATQAHVDRGLATSVGQITKVPEGVHVQADGTVWLTVAANAYRESPCTPNPCLRMRMPRCDVINYYTAKCSRHGTFHLSLRYKPKDALPNPSYFDFCVTGSQISDSSKTCLVTTDTANFLPAAGAVTGPACGVTITKAESSDGGVITVTFSEVASDKSKYQDFTYAVIAKYYCSGTQTPACADAIQNAVADKTSVSMVVSYDGTVQERYYIPRKTSAAAAFNPNPLNKKHYFFGCFRPGPSGHYLNTYYAGFYDPTDVVYEGKTIGDQDLCSVLPSSSASTPAAAPTAYTLPAYDWRYSWSHQPQYQY